ncbi:hypothetical protein D3C80_1867560 [compost metagenome]
MQASCSLVTARWGQRPFTDWCSPQNMVPSTRGRWHSLAAQGGSLALVSASAIFKADLPSIRSERLALPNSCRTSLRAWINFQAA